MSDLPKRVLIAEEGPREGFQSEKKMIPVADKVRLIEALADTGLRHIACVSYVNPKRVPTMADAEEVASKIRQKPGIEYSALWLNQQGLERALRGPLHVDGGVRVTASDTFSRKNIGKSVPDAMVEQRMSLKTFKDRGMPVEWGIILGAFGCNYEGELSTELILQRVQLALDEAELAGFKLKGIKLTDAMGWATPRSVERLIGAVRNKWPELEIALHLHDTRGTGQATAYAGLRMGVTKFDASIAGLGGCPFAATDGAAGNICTEDFAFMCEEMGVETGLDIDRLIEVARLAEEVVGRPLPGHVMRGGTLTAAKQRGQRMNAETFIPDSTYVDVPSIPWKPTRFPGVEAKTLMENPATGMSTVLMRWAPGRAPSASRTCCNRADLRPRRLVRRSHGRLPRRQLCVAPPGQPSRRLDRRRLPDAGLLPEAQHLLRLKPASRLGNILPR